MAIGGPIGIDDDHLATLSKSRPKPPKEGIGFGHFVVHVNQKNAVETVDRKLRIIFLAELDRNIIEPFPLDAATKSFERIAIDILRQDSSGRPNPL